MVEELPPITTTNMVAASVPVTEDNELALPILQPCSSHSAGIL
jgi:hypothetical protein